MVTKAPSQTEPYLYRSHSKSLMSKKTPNATAFEISLEPTHNLYFFSNILACLRGMHFSPRNTVTGRQSSWIRAV